MAGVFQLDHLQQIKLILFKNFSNCFNLLLGSPIIYYPRERGRHNMAKSNAPEMDVTQDVQCLEYSNGTICSHLSRFFSRILPTVSLYYWGVQLSITSVRGRQNMTKGNSPEMDETQEVQCLGYSNWTICSHLS